MIIDNGYFINEIFLPQAKPDASYGVLEVESSLSFFVAKYESDCLFRVLGAKLFKEFSAQLDYDKDSKLKEGTDEKWDKLLNGSEYTTIIGEEKTWRGIRSKNPSSNTYNSSFLANYIYYYHEKSDNDTRSNTGNVQESSKNAFLVDKTPKIVRAWNEFVEWIGHSEVKDPYFFHKGALCADYMQGSMYVTLHEFITDMNEIDSETYKDYNPQRFFTINQFGI